MNDHAVLLGVISILAILAGPIFAVQAQVWLERRREARNRKLWIFKTLMSYRATNLAPIFVQSLNLIDVEFNGDNDKKKTVRTAWKVLLDHFSDLPQNSAALTATLTANLLLAMGKCLGYGDFDEVNIKKGAYYPQGLGNVEQEQHALRREVLELLDGKRRLPVALFEDKFPDLIPERDAGDPTRNRG